MCKVTKIMWIVQICFDLSFYLSRISFSLTEFLFFSRNSRNARNFIAARCFPPEDFFSHKFYKLSQIIFFPQITQFFCLRHLFFRHEYMRTWFFALEFYRCAMFFAHKWHKFGLMRVANGGVATECEWIDFGSIANPITFASFNIAIDIGVDGHKCYRWSHG